MSLIKPFVPLLNRPAAIKSRSPISCGCEIGDRRLAGEGINVLTADD